MFFLFFLLFILIIPFEGNAQFQQSPEQTLIGWEQQEGNEEGCGLSVKCWINTTINNLLKLFLYLSVLIAKVCRWLLSWVLGTGFTDYSYTNPDTNPIIAQGLGITQSLVNMGFVLILVYIALVTILNLQGYETKKLLVTFVVVALLVNFAPVFCGLIVDASNIVMNFFIFGGFSGDEGIGASPILEGSQKLVDSATEEPKTWGTVISNAVKVFLLVVYFLIVAVIYLLYALLFAVRYYIIWILVILSPIAFAGYILPATRREITINKWWNLFLQWTLIGAIGAFFLFLGESYINSMMEEKEIREFAPSAETTDKDEAENLGLSISFVLFPIILSGLGLFFTLHLSAMGAQGAMKWGKRAAKSPVALAGKTRAGDWAKDQKTRIQEKTGFADKGTTARQQQERYKKSQSNMEAEYKRDPESVKKTARSKIATKEDRAAAAAVSANEGDLDIKNPNEIKNYKEATKMGINTREAENKDPRLAALNVPKVKKIMQKEGVSEEEAQKKAIAGAVQRQSAPKLAENLSADAIPDVMEHITDEQFNNSKFRENLSPEQVNAFQNLNTPGAKERNQVEDRLDELGRKAMELHATGQSQDIEKADRLEQEMQNIIDRLDSIKVKF